MGLVEYWGIMNISLVISILNCEKCASLPDHINISDCKYAEIMLEMGVLGKASGEGGVLGRYW